ncbi:oligopeptidase B [Paucibacter oligotrophus]|uniref:Oligopeptidase B n=1 Tax=Roseateles oligotrophus TaxID=1769250 RepID=A0A840L473_9BURK|nr:S9 family peptidase [Roseateles oligotrophus]MBB4841643.1 oligopeptidase B [Roseateles oligotrophus]
MILLAKFAGRRLLAPLFLALLLAQATALLAQPPMAERRPKDVSIHGDTRIDDFFWLREKERPEVMAHLNAESAYTAAWFQPLAGLQERLYQEMLGRVQQKDEAVPVREGAWWYSSRTVEGAQYPVFIRRPAQGPARSFDAAAAEQVLLDMNELARGRKFMALGGMMVSPDGKRLAYTTDDSGARDFELKIRDLASAQDLGWRAQQVASLQWSADGRYLFYITSNAAKRRDRLWRHALDGSAPDVLVYEDKDPLYNLELSNTADGRFLSLISRSKDASEVRLLPSRQPLGDWALLLARKPGLEYAVEHREGQLYLLSNDRGPNFRLARLPLPDLRRLPLQPRQLAAAQELLAHRDEAMLESITMFKTHLAVQLREQGSVKLRVYEHARFKPQDIPFEQAVYTATSNRGLNREYDSPSLRLSYQSMTTPVSVYDYGFASRKLSLLKRQPVQGGYEAGRYETRRIWAQAADGTQVPVSLVWAKPLRRQGPQPLLLQGYGSYGSSSDPRFSLPGLSLLERGVIIAVAHVRGGGDLGRRWYLEGKLAKKMNTFTDFIAASEALVAQGFTEPAQLIISGGSAGGLLMGAVTNLRPDLYKAVVAEVPFVDVINTMLDESLPLTTEEFIEWGNPKIAEQYRWMRAYSPYDNLKPGAYPAILARTGLNDSQVPYWEAAKYVAKLRTLKSNPEVPLLFDINMTAGHGGASGRFDGMKERAKVYAFMLQQWGLTD